MKNERFYVSDDLFSSLNVFGSQNSKGLLFYFIESGILKNIDDNCHLFILSTKILSRNANIFVTKQYQFDMLVA